MALVIPIENLNRTKYTELYVKDRKRLATATGVNFINKNLIVVTNLVAMKMYLYQMDYDQSEWKLVNEIDTIFDGKPTITDLLDYNGKDLIITSNCDNGCQTIYKLENNNLVHFKDVCDQDSLDGFCHGIRFHPYYHGIICATIFKNCKINFIDHETNELRYQICYDVSYRPKDLALINKNKIIVLYTNSRIKQVQTEENFITRLVVYEIDLDKKEHRILLTYDVPNSHGDSIIYHNGTVFINNQIKDTIEVFGYKDNKLNKITDISGFSMPHGLSYEPASNLLAVTNYGNNTVSILKLTEIY